MTNVARGVVALVIALTGLQALQGTSGSAVDDELTLAALSSDPSLVTGGDVLVEVAARTGTISGVTVTAAGRDVTGAFRPRSARAMVGLVRGLAVGFSSIEAVSGTSRASLGVTNYPITGPVISGPWQRPFVCQTQAFVLPDGSRLGPALDASCSARTVVQYVYRPVHVADPTRPFKPLPGTRALPSDVSQTKTIAGTVVNFIVRVETGTMNRGIYQNAILHDPTSDPPPSPLTPPRGWNRRLIALQGTGCPGGWYVQGAAQGATLLDPGRLAEGYALFVNTLNHASNNCNAVLAAETTMMGKEHFVETFGVPLYTVSTGRSGGAYTSLQIADAFPGLFDGVETGETFPDSLSIALSGLDARLLAHYFSTTAEGGLTPPQQAAVSGYSTVKALTDAANEAQRTDPVPDRRDLAGYQSARWQGAVPQELRYDPIRNPQGARPTIFDAARNVYGVDPVNGFARRPYDNVGVQYGLQALNTGVISVRQFLDLNDRIGGVDADANYIRARSEGDPLAILRAYQSGLLLGANGGLRAIPIVDNAASNEAARYHYGWFHFALRERLRRNNVRFGANLVMWRSGGGEATRRILHRWVAAYVSDRSEAAPIDRVLRAKPGDAVDGCYDRSKPPVFLIEDLVFTSKPTTRCSRLYPVYANPRYQAGGPLAADILKCQLKPVDPTDYAVPFAPAELARLRAIFPSGVCDWSRPGVNQVPVVTWASFGPSPKNRLN